MLGKPKGSPAGLLPSRRRSVVAAPPETPAPFPRACILLARVAESPSRPATVQPKAPRHRCLLPPPPANGSHTDPSHVMQSGVSMRIRHPGKKRPGRAHQRNPPVPRTEREAPAPSTSASRAPDVVATPPRSITNKAGSHRSSTVRAAHHYISIHLCIHTHLMACLERKDFHSGTVGFW